jgi:amino-acid N-acetyltransferase
MATELKIREIYLLTTTAAEFFTHLGYRQVDRALAPAAIASTKEFSSLCPSTAVFMVKP